jgi:hypothetical protein
LTGPAEIGLMRVKKWPATVQITLVREIPE